MAFRYWSGVFAAAVLSLSVTDLSHGSGEEPSKKEQAYADTAATIIETSLYEGQAYAMLAQLTSRIGARLSGSPQAAAAVEWGRQAMIEAGLENVRLQEVMVPRWVRGPVEEAAVLNSPSVGTRSLTVCALGGSVGTPKQGLTGEVVEVRSFDEVHALGESARGKIIFYNRPMDSKRIDTFAAYGGAVDQRSGGAVEAARAGAAAVLVRSMTTRLDDVPHTGGMGYEEGVLKIPAAAISTLDAEFLHGLLQTDRAVRVRLALSCKTLPDAPSANVIGELAGSKKPDEIIVIGGHLDSWDKGQGAHDDGAGCVQSIEALRLLKQLKLKPKRTIRCVLFMNEENGTRGGRAYAENAQKEKVKHVAAIEGDRGGFAPRGFDVKTDDDKLSRISRWAYLFESIGASAFRAGHGGVDIDPLGETLGIPTMGLVVESHRYFDYHHSDSDTFDKVNERELAAGAAAMAILAYVLANEGV